MLTIVQPGYEAHAEKELATFTRRTVSERGPGWLRDDSPPPPDDQVAALAFPHLILTQPQEITGDSVNALAGAVLEHFLASLRDERVADAWPMYWEGPAERVGLGRRIGAVEEAFLAQLKKRVSRVARLASPSAGPVLGHARGLFVYFVDFRRAYVSRTAWRNGQRRMADDPLAPSRSYLKIEEAYGVLGREPKPNETVVDLGAAPGGWSYSAAKRGARAIAVDNGPLKGGAADNPLIEHQRADAFHYAPSAPVDWLFCDLVEEPHHVFADILRPWLQRGLCRNFVVNLKFGRVDPIGLLQELRAAQVPAKIRHLYHDREEFTLVGGQT